MHKTNYFFCGPVPIDPWTGAGPRPSGWGPLLYIPQNFRSDLRKITAISSCHGFLSFFQTDSFRGSSTLCDQASWLVNGSCKVDVGGGSHQWTSQMRCFYLFTIKMFAGPLKRRRTAKLHADMHLALLDVYEGSVLDGIPSLSYANNIPTCSSVIGLSLLIFCQRLTSLAWSYCANRQH